MFGSLLIKSLWYTSFIIASLTTISSEKGYLIASDMPRPEVVVWRGGGGGGGGKNPFLSTMVVLNQWQ